MTNLGTKRLGGPEKTMEIIGAQLRGFRGVRSNRQIQSFGSGSPDTMGVISVITAHTLLCHLALGCTVNLFCFSTRSRFHCSDLSSHANWEINPMMSKQRVNKPSTDGCSTVVLKVGGCDGVGWDWVVSWWGGVGYRAPNSANNSGMHTALHIVLS